MTMTAVATEQKYIYLIVSQTGSVIAKALKAITKAQYNHISLSFREDIQSMYSFGRRLTFFPFWGGFVEESPHFGTMKKFSDAQIVVIAVPVSDEVYAQLRQRIDMMFERRKRYHYNNIGLFLAWFKIARTKTDCYYCSEFVRELFVHYRIDGYEQLPPITKPVEFLSMPGCREVYRGTLAEYAQKTALSEVR